MTENRAKLQELLTDIFLIAPEDFRFDMQRSEIDTWDSLAVVSIAVGVEETFGHHMLPEQAIAIDSVNDIMSFLKTQGVAFDE